jgi:hypothetical protein
MVATIFVRRIVSTVAVGAGRCVADRLLRGTLRARLAKWVRGWQAAVPEMLLHGALGIRVGSRPEENVDELRAQHNPSSARTKFILASAGSSLEAPTIQKFNPETLKIAVDNTVSGSTLTAYATLTEEPAARAVSASSE